MSSDLHTRLRSLRSVERRIVPDATWVRATRATIVMQVANTIPTNRVSRIERLREVVRHFFTVNFGGLVRKPLMAALSILVVAMGGSIMSVSAAERSLPGDFLYGLKLATEQARLAWVSTKEDKLKLKTEFTGRRVNELKEVATHVKSDARVQQVAEILKSDLNTLKEQLGDMKNDATSEDAVAAAKLVDQKTNEVITTLQGTKTDMSPETKAKVTEAQSVAAETSVRAIEVLVEKNQESNDIVPVADVTEAIQNHANTVASVTQAPLEVLGSASSTPSSVASLAQAMATGTSASASSSAELPKLMDQVKDMTTQAFAAQKAIDLEEVAASASSTASGEAAASASSTESSAPVDASSSSTLFSP